MNDALDTAEDTQDVCPIPLDSLSAAARRGADPRAPLPARLMAARGMAPMAPRDLVTAQYVLTFDPDESVKEAASTSLASMDARIANAVLGDRELNEHLLGYLAQLLSQRDAEVERVLLNSSTPGWAFEEVAKVCSEHVAEIIANNQKRILEEPTIAKGLIQNPNARKASIDRVVDFLVRNSIILDGVAEFEHALLRLSPRDRVEAAGIADIPKELLDEKFLTDEDRAEIDETGRRFIADEDEEIEEEEEEQGGTMMSPKKLDQLLRTLTTGKKVALATKGNRSVRNRLLRDTNRVVALAAITSPMITDPEVLSTAQSRIVHQDVINWIANQKDHVKNYQVRLALTGNPKTPVASAMKFVGTLHKKDLKALAGSKNIPAGVRQLATRLVKQRKA